MMEGVIAIIIIALMLACPRILCLMVKTRGFTLIELLIVVAIIAILAAIAVPNFLEAQVRAKIATAYSDIRTIRGALTTYYMDNGAYLPDQGGSNEAVDWVRLTTPIAYLNTVLNSPFKTTGTNHEQYGTGTADPFWYGVYGKKHAFRKYGIMYEMGCAGPDLDCDWILLGNPIVNVEEGKGGLEFFYNSTNGTKSSGDIIATNKGVYHAN